MLVAGSINEEKNNESAFAVGNFRKLMLIAVRLRIRASTIKSRYSFVVGVRNVRSFSSNSVLPSRLIHEITYGRNHLKNGNYIERE